MITLIIAENDSGQRLDRFLVKKYHSLPPSVINKSIRKKDIKINGKRCQNNSILSSGDVLTLYIHDKFLSEQKLDLDFINSPALRDENILFENENILIANKNAGQLTHPDGAEFVNTLISSAQRYLYEKGDYLPEKEHSFAPAACNRLDRNTCGIVIIAKTAAALREVNEAIRNKKIEKYYLCLVVGILEEKSGRLKAYHTKNPTTNKVYLSSEPAENSSEIETKYRVLSENKSENNSLLEINLITGKTHQIRAHLASIGHPILGDIKYGGPHFFKAPDSCGGFPFFKSSDNKRSIQALCAYRIKFVEPIVSMSGLGEVILPRAPWFLENNNHNFG